MQSEFKHPRHLPRENHKRLRTKHVMLIVAGIALVLVATFNRLRAPSAHGSLFGVFLAIGAFLYLWWLGIVLFDLVFVWYRYVRHDAAMEFLRTRVYRRPSPDNPPANQVRASSAE